MNYNIKEDAKYKIYNSELVKYVSPEKIEEAFSKIHTYDNINEFLETYGKPGYSNGRLEGFNRNGESYIGPNATSHTVIHEVLHTLSSRFDSEGHRIINGISGYKKEGFGNIINEGITDYLATKISGEAPRNYIEGHKLFCKLEPMMIKYTKDQNILMQIYTSNNVKFMQEFLDYFGKNNTFEDLYNNFLFKNDEEIDKLLKPVKKNVNKYVKRAEKKENIANLLNKIHNIFSKNKIKMLPEGSKENSIQKNSHERFVTNYNINNFETKMNDEYLNSKRKEQKETSNEIFKEL